LLVDKLIEDTSLDSDLPSHASELLVSLVHQAPLDSPVLQKLSSGKILQKIVEKASVLREGEEFVSHETGMASALSVLESIILQLGGFGCVPPVDESMSISFVAESSEAKKDSENEPPPENTMNGDISPALHESDVQKSVLANESKSNKVANANDLIRLLPDSLAQWNALLRNEVTNSWVVMNQIGKLIPMVGASRLRIVRLIEALVLLAHPVIDEQLMKANSVDHCLNLFFEFEWCSMLHQSVANLVVHGKLLP